MEDALTTWQSAGSPALSGLGLAVDTNGTPRVWLGDPDGPSWNLPV